MPILILKIVHACGCVCVYSAKCCQMEVMPFFITCVTYSQDFTLCVVVVL